MPKTIVLPIALGHTEHARQQVAMAKAIGGEDAKIVLTTIIEALPTYAMVHIPDGFQAKARTAAEAELKGVAEDTGISPEIEVRVGYPSTDILAVASDKSADAIVIASHRPGLEDYFIGSTAARVVRHAKCSVLVLR